MRWVKFLVSLILTSTLIGSLTIPMGGIPFSIGAFMDPFGGFWKNAHPTEAVLPLEIPINRLQSPVDVVMDDRGVPHIFAENQEDLFFVQGYLTARDRLWQMEFQMYAAEGRLSEIFGPGPDSRLVYLDRLTRRKGLVFAAERSRETILSNPDTRKGLEAYTAGVNEYIASISAEDYPIEYKLFNYAPEPWSVLKTALLTKYMANTLAARNNDLEYTYALQRWGRKVFDVLYPEYSYKRDPVIPVNVYWDPSAATPSPLAPSDYHPDSLMVPPVDWTNPRKHIGSNNWAVSPAMSTTGGAILANDPHLRLSLPSIWYEVQLNTPEFNAYGVTIPGAPGILIGFNDSIAWGQTNSGQDVMDFYTTTFRDKRRTEYLYDGQWLPVNERIEKLDVKGVGEVFDTVLYTNVGPVIFDKNFGEVTQPLAMRWMAHEPSNEALSFLGLLKANNYEDYVEAISHFECPAQNFVFASSAGDIAIWQQGKYVNKWREQGRFVLDGSKREHMWKGFIPQNQNPHILNPPREFVSSANQRPTTGYYPYYYNGGFASFRAKRINQLLRIADSVSVSDMKSYQLDNFSIKAQDVLPILLADLDTSVFTLTDKKAFEILKNWDYQYDRNQVAPTIFQAWWNDLYERIWADEFSAFDVDLARPSDPTTVQILMDSLYFSFYYDTNDSLKKDRKSLVNRSFDEVVGKLHNEFPDQKDWEWGQTKTTTIQHLTQQLPSFSRTNIPTDGYKGILNATSEFHGPSWRMVVSLGKKVEAYGIYPGGQSGNPGNPNYDSFIDDWSKGEYYRLWFMPNANDTSRNISGKQRFIKEAL